MEHLTLPERVAHPDFLKTEGQEYGLTEANAGALLKGLCPTETHCVAVRLGDWVLASVPGEMTAGLGLEVKAAAHRQTGVKHVAIAGLADEWISYMLSPDEYRQGGYEASVSFYGETLGPVMVRAAGSAIRHLSRP